MVNVAATSTRTSLVGLSTGAELTSAEVMWEHPLSGVTIDIEVFVPANRLRTEDLVVASISGLREVFAHVPVQLRLWASPAVDEPIQVRLRNRGSSEVPFQDLTQLYTRRGP